MREKWVSSAEQITSGPKKASLIDPKFTFSESESAAVDRIAKEAIAGLLIRPIHPPEIQKILDAKRSRNVKPSRRQGGSSSKKHGNGFVSSVTPTPSTFPVNPATTAIRSHTTPRVAPISLGNSPNNRAARLHQLGRG